MRNIFMAFTGLLLFACVSTNQSPKVAPGFSVGPMSDGSREPASVREGDKFKSFQSEFGAAAALNSYTGLLGYNMEKQSKLAVLMRWALMAPLEVRKSFAAASEGFEIGYHRSRATGRTSLIRVIFKSGDASEISQNQISFAPDVAMIDVPDNDRDQKLIEQALPQIEKDLPQMAAQLIQDRHYEAKHLGGRSYAHLDVVSDLGLVLPEAVTAKYFGLARLNPAKAREWSHAWRDQVDFNAINDSRVNEQAQAVLQEANSARSGLKTSLSGSALLRLVSHEHVTEAAVAQSIDILLKNPNDLLRARQASEQGRSFEIDALVTEALRLSPVDAYQLLIVKDDITLRSGLQLKKGQSVLL